MIAPRASRLAGVIAIVVSLSVSLSGILFFGWDWREIIVLYWLTNITVGLTTLITIARADTTLQTSKLHTVTSVVPSGLVKFAMGGFFCLHYGIFTTVHGIFVFAVVNGAFFGPSNETPINFGPLFISWLFMSATMVATKLLTPSTAQPFESILNGPYKRIVALHISIIGGVFIIQLLSLPALSAVLLIVLNTIFELNELRPTQKADNPQAVTPASSNGPIPIAHQ